MRFELPARRRLIGEWVRCAATALVLFGCGIAAAQSGSPDILDTLSPEQRQQLIDAYAESRPMGSNDGSFEQYGSGEVPQARGSEGGSGVQDDPVLGAERQRQARQRVLQLRRQYLRFTDTPFSANLEPFGYSLFIGAAPSTFAPVDNFPVPADYVVGPGDLIRVQIYENNNASYALEISRDGAINIPGIGPVDVAGLRFAEVQQTVQDQIEQRIIGAKADVTLGRLRSMQVFLVGDVNQPGSYTVSSLSTMTNALFQGGGVGLSGSLRKIQLKRGGRVVSTLDLYDLLIHGDAHADLRLMPGDVIFVPPVGAQVAVDGEVKRPAIYELDGERTVGQMLELAGGLQASSSAAATIERVSPSHGRVIVDIGRDGVIERSAPVHDGDAIKIKQVSPRIEDKVRVEGFVKYPGRYQWSAGMSLADVLQVAAPLSSDSGEEAYFPAILIERTTEAGGVRRWSALQRGPGGLVPAESLRPNDLIVVLSRSDVEYLSSSDVRSAVAGGGRQVSSCPGLDQLTRLLSSQRASRLVQIFASERDSFGMSDQWGDIQEAANGDARNRDDSAYDGYLPATPGQQAQNRNQALILGQGTANGQGDAFITGNGQAGRSARLVSSSDPRSQLPSSAAGQQLAPPSQCPRIYQRVPQILPFLLERSVAVFGEVRRPGLYPVADGTALRSVVDAAGGLTAEGNRENVEYVSYAQALETGQSRYQTLDVGQDQTLAIDMHPGDILNFRPVYVGQENGVVRLYGEVRFPGAYSIIRGERLSDIIRRAGGLTDQAYPYGAVLTRESARRAEQITNQRAAKDLREALVTAVTSGALPDSDASSGFLSGIVQSLESSPTVGRVVTETDPQVLAARPELDIVVEPGDKLYMPKRPATVTVTGQVLNAGTVAFVSGRDASEYIDMAGGFTQGADDERAFLILPSGQARKLETSFWNFRRIDVPPGSYIVVPRDATPLNGWVLSEKLLGIFSNLAVSAAALAVIGDNN
ncbi:MAG: SLBB domain-containing protein [Pseudomonadota bacterium]|nr:SLBB domain-containing protein [Pseudomonadota bacterium]